MVIELARDIFIPLGQSGADAFDDTEDWRDSRGYQLAERLWQARRTDRAAITKILREGIAAGEDPLKLARRLEDYLTPAARPERNPKTGRLERNQPRSIVTRTPRSGAGSYAARRLARTEVTRAFGQATTQAAALNPFVEGVKWNLSARHGRPDECDDNARGHSEGMPAGVYRVGEEPRYPNHPHCFPDGTLVETETGSRPIELVGVGDSVLTHEGRFQPVTAIHARQYVGPLVTIALEQRNLLVTPEHPLLTERGWIEAACLQPGDNLCRAGVGIRHDAFVGKVQNLPTRLAQLLISGRVSSRVGMPLNAVTLDDESGRGNNQVRPATTNTMSMFSSNTGTLQSILHQALNLAAPMRFRHAVVDVLLRIGRKAGAMDGAQFRAHLRARGGVVGFLRGADLGSHLWPFGRVAFAAEVESLHRLLEFDGLGGASLRSPSWQHGFGNRAHRNVKAFAEATKHAERDAPFVREPSAGNALNEIALSEQGLEVFPEQSFDTGDVTILGVEPVTGVFDRVLHVGIIANFHGMVRNFEVEMDATYAVEGVVAHNCLCFLTPFVTRSPASVVAQLRRDFDPDPQAAQQEVIIRRRPLREKVTLLFQVVRAFMSGEAA